MQANMPTPEGDLSCYKWVATRILSTNMTYTLLIQQQLLTYQIFRKALGRLFHPSSLFLLDSGVLNIVTTMTIGSQIIDLSHYFVVPEMVVSLTLMKSKAGTGLQKRDFYLVVLSEKDMSFDLLPPIDRLRLLKQCTTKEEYLKARDLLLSEH